jgi:hypothetical protein
MDPSVTTLQNAINRFAAVGGFSKVDVDGAWGAKTKQGVYSSLAFIGQGKCYQGNCPDNNTSKNAAALMAQWDESMNAAKGLAEFLNGVANELGMPLVASPVSPGSLPIPGSGILHPSNYGAMASWVDKFAMLPLWQRVAIGALGALGLVWAVNRFKGKKAKR